jgi:hypothetical protein
MALPTSRQDASARSETERYLQAIALWLCGYGGPIEELADFEHRVHRHRQFSCYGNGSSFEGYPLPHMTSSGSRGVMSLGAYGQDLGRRVFQDNIWQVPFRFRISGLAPNCMTRLVSEHDQPHIRSPLRAAAP